MVYLFQSCKYFGVSSHLLVFSFTIYGKIFFIFVRCSKICEGFLFCVVLFLYGFCFGLSFFVFSCFVLFGTVFFSVLFSIFSWALLSFPKFVGKMKCFQQEALNHLLLCSENCSLHASLCSAHFPWMIRTTTRNFSQLCEKLIVWGYYEILSKMNIFYWSKIYCWSSVALREPPSNFRYQWKLTLMPQYPITSEPRSI